METEKINEELQTISALGKRITEITEYVNERGGGNVTAEDLRDIERQANRLKAAAYYDEAQLVAIKMQNIAKLGREMVAAPTKRKARKKAAQFARDTQAVKAAIYRYTDWVVLEAAVSSAKAVNK